MISKTATVSESFELRRKITRGGPRPNSGGPRANSGGTRANSGGARANTGGARANSGGRRRGAGRLRKLVPEPDALPMDEDSGNVHPDPVIETLTVDANVDSHEEIWDLTTQETVAPPLPGMFPSFYVSDPNSEAKRGDTSDNADFQKPKVPRRRCKNFDDKSHTSGKCTLKV